MGMLQHRYVTRNLSKIEPVFGSTASENAGFEKL
jgi:hypothetical protein